MSSIPRLSTRSESNGRDLMAGKKESAERFLTTGAAELGDTDWRELVTDATHHDRRYLEDFSVGQRFEPAGDYIMKLDEMTRYARQFDPQTIHTDEERASTELYGQLIASGWMTLGVTTRLMVQSRVLGSTPVVGVAIDNLRFLEPVYAGDVLAAEAEVLEIRPSKSKPERGYLVTRVVTRRRNDGKPVLTQDWTLLMPRRTTANG
jgi:acyl dehydratase